MKKYRKPISIVLSLALVMGSLFIGSISTLASSTTTVNTYDDENTSYRTEVMGNENNSFLTVNGVEESWYRFAAWSTSVEKDTTKTGIEQNAVHFVKAAKYNYQWPAAVKIYNNDEALSHFKATPDTTYEIRLSYYVDTKPSIPINLQVRSRPSINLFSTFTYDESLVFAPEVATITDVTNGWVEATAVFTTPEAEADYYLNLTLSSANSTNASNVSVWVDDISLSVCKMVTAHNYDGNDKTIRVSDITTLADLDVPTYEGYRLEGVYSDALYTKKLSASDKLNAYTDIYYNWVKLSNDTYYCGFEDYAEQLSGQNTTAQMNGMSFDSEISQLTSEDCYTGNMSMKNTLASNGIAAFELRNNKAFEIFAGKEYRVSFAYKASSDAKIQLGVGKASDICGSAYGITGIDITASDSWSTAEVTFTADKGTSDDYALTMLVYAEDAATVYIDDVLIMDTEDISFSEMPELEYNTNWYPILSAFGDNEKSSLWSGSVATSFAVGEGTEASPYEISSGEELALAITSGGGADKYYKLTKDIYLNDISKVNWYNGATCYSYTPKSWYAHGRTFQGTIDGDGHTIYGIYYDMNTGARTSYRYGCGLVPEVAAGTSVAFKNLGVDCVYINYESGASAFVGCALNGASVDVDGCYVGDKATIIGADSGAFQGHSYQVTTISIKNSYSLGEVTGTHSYGLVGNRWSGSISISNSFNGNGALLSMAANSKIVLSNCYQSVAGKITAGVTTLTADNMKGADVLTSASKMVNLNTDGVFKTSTRSLADADYYIYLPEGTEFESTDNVSFWDTMLMPMNSPLVIGNTGVMKRGAYAKFSSIPAENTVFVPTNVYDLVHQGFRRDLLKETDYYSINTQKITKKLDEQSDKAVNYIFVSDIHSVSLPGNAGENHRALLLRQLSHLVSMANENDDIDFVVIGGDLTDGKAATKEKHFEYIHQGLSPFLDCQKPVFVVFGNHDDNSYPAKLSEVASDKDWNDQLIDKYVNRTLEDGSVIVVNQDSNDENSKYYYYDIEAKKTRVVCIDGLDYNMEYDENGDITKLLDIADASLPETDFLRYRTARIGYGYSDEQIKWLVNEALTAGDGWNYVFFSHAGIDRETQFGGYTVRNATPFRDIISALQYKTAYTNEELGINVDYSNTDSQLLTFHFGHTHSELSLYSEDINLWQINSSSAKIGGYASLEGVQNSTINVKSLNWHIYEYPRRLLNEGEANFDIMSAIREGVYKMNIGVGVTQKYITPTNTAKGDVNLDGEIDICDAVKLAFADTNNSLSMSADVDNNKKFEVSLDLAAIRNILIY